MADQISNSEAILGVVARIERQRDNLFDLFEERIKKLRKFAEMSDDISAENAERVVIDLIKELPSEDPSRNEEEQSFSSQSKRMSPGSKKHYEGTISARMVEYFKDNFNSPASNMMIRQAIGATRGTVAMVLYNTHSDTFEKIRKDDDHIVYWRMTESAWTEATGGYNQTTSGYGNQSSSNTSGAGDDIPF